MPCRTRYWPRDQNRCTCLSSLSLGIPTTTRLVGRSGAILQQFILRTSDKRSRRISALNDIVDAAGVHFFGR